MGTVEIHQFANSNAYQANLPQPVDPLAHLYKLEHDLAQAEQNTASMIDDLTKRLDSLETRVSSINDDFADSNRQLEKDILSLADRLFELEDRAA